MTVHFIVQHNNQEKNIQFSMDKTILDLKKEIINQYNLNCKAIDIFVDLQVPIRGMGKYTLEKGMIQRGMDNYTMNKFNIEKKNIVITFKELENEYSMNSVKKTNFGKGKYVPPRLRKNEKISVEKKQLNINDLNEFPLLA